MTKKYYMIVLVENGPFEHLVEQGLILVKND